MRVKVRVQSLCLVVLQCLCLLAITQCSKLPLLHFVRPSAASLPSMANMRGRETAREGFQLLSELSVGSDMQEYYDLLEPSSSPLTRKEEEARLALDRVRRKVLLSASALLSPPISLTHSQSLTPVNVYSDELLLSALSSPAEETLVVLKLYRSNCKRCTLFDSEILPHLLSSLTSSPFTVFLQADIDNIPQYTSTHINRRLQGRDEKDMASCNKCLGKGVVTCSLCEGKGYEMRGSIAVFCNQCGGKKITRCDKCGGKCVMC